MRDTNEPKPQARQAKASHPSSRPGTLWHARQIWQAAEAGLDQLKRKARTVAVAAAAALLAASCQEEPQREQENKENSIKIGTLSQSVSYYEKNGRTMGYEYDLARAFAKSQGKGADFVVCKDVNELVNNLQNGQLDIAAYPIVVSNDYRQKVAFTNHTYITHQVLVQRIPSRKAKKKARTDQAFRRAKKNNLPIASDTAYIADVTELIGREVWVTLGSKFQTRMHNLDDEVGGGIKIRLSEDGDEEDLIDMVAVGKIDYMVCDEKTALANMSDYANLDISTKVSFDQRAAWAVNDTAMQRRVNEWEEEAQTKKAIAQAYKKYFEPRKKTKVFRGNMKGQRPKGDNEVSGYDDIFKREAKATGLDWKLVAAIACRESKFYPNVVGWNGSMGLMQLMPATGMKMGAKSREDLLDPDVNIRSGCRYLKALNDYFAGITDPMERQKFLIAAFNAGHGHVRDARRLAKKYGKDPDIWDGNVEQYIRLKTKRQYFTDPVVNHGYLNGNLVANYVNAVEELYEGYKGIKPQIVDPDEIGNND